MLDDFLETNPQHKNTGVREVKAGDPLAPSSPDAIQPMDKTTADGGLVWVRDDGHYSVWRAETLVTIVLDHTRKCHWVGSSAGIQMGPQDQIMMLTNLDNCNFDSYRCI